MKRSLGTTLLVVGTLICVLGAVGLTLGMFVTIPPELAHTIVRVAGFSAPFLAGGAFMIAGAAVLRAGRAADEAQKSRAAELPPPAVVVPPPRPDAAEPVERPPAGRRAT